MVTFSFNPFDLNIESYCKYHNISLKQMEKFVKDDIKLLQHHLKELDINKIGCLKHDPIKSERYQRLSTILEFEVNLLNFIEIYNKMEEIIDLFPHYKFVD